MSKNIIGTIREVAGIEWRVLDKTEDGYKVIAEESIDTRVFDSDSNDWKKSSLREEVNTKLRKKLEDAGVKLVEFERDLISLDGQTEYGTCRDFVSLLTPHEYQKYRKHLPNKDYWWWMIAPWSTPCNGYKYYITVVAPSGCFYLNLCDYGRGVRPVCIFDSSIFES